MQAIEFETTARQQAIRLPPGVPDGVNLRVLVLLEEQPTLATANSSKEPNRPAPQLVRSVSMEDDLIAPAGPESDWSTLR